MKFFCARHNGLLRVRPAAGAAAAVLTLLVSPVAQAQLTINRLIDAGSVEIAPGHEAVSSLVWTNNGLTGISAVSVRVVLSSLAPPDNAFTIGQTDAYLSYNIGESNSVNNALVYGLDPANEAVSLDATFAVAGNFASPGATNTWDLLVANDGGNAGTAAFNYWRLIVTGEAATNGTIEPGAGGIISATDGYVVRATLSLGTTGSVTVRADGGTSFALQGPVTGTGELVKTGAGTVVMSGAGDYSGATRIEGGTLSVGAGGTLGAGDSDVFISSGAQLNVDTSVIVDSVREAGTNNGGTINLGTGATLTVDGADKGALYQNSISGAGNLSIGASGDTSLTLYGTQSYTGSTAVSGGKLSTGVALATSGVNVSGGGTFETTAANILSDTATVTMSGGTYALGGSDTVGGLSGSGGTLNLGSHTLTANVAANNTYTFGGSIIGTGGITKSGLGRLSLSGNNSYSGATAVNAGELNLAGGSIANSAVTVASGASLTGYGRVGALGGAGSIGPGNSPGIITATQIDLSGGLDFNFEFTGNVPVFDNAASSVNDLIRITGATPFSQSLGAANIINIYFSGAALFTGNTAVQYKGGFFTDGNGNFSGEVDNASFNYFFAYAGVLEPTVYNGINYGTRAQYETALGYELTITISTIGQSANFDGVTTLDGRILQLEVIPEPGTYALLALAATGFVALRLRRNFRRDRADDKFR